MDLYPTDFMRKPKVSRFVLFEPFIALAKPTDYHCQESTKAKGEEEPKEPLGIVTEIAAIIFLVSLTDFFPFISNHFIDFTDMYLHLWGHPLAFFSKLFLNFLPVSIIDIYRQISNQVGNEVEQKSNEVEGKSNQVRDSDTKKVSLSNKQRDIVNFCSVPRTTAEIMERLGLSNQTKNRERYITSLVAAGYLQMTNPDNPTASNQKYKKVNK